MAHIITAEEPQRPLNASLIVPHYPRSDSLRWFLEECNNPPAELSVMCEGEDDDDE